MKKRLIQAENDSIVKYLNSQKHWTYKNMEECLKFLQGQNNAELVIRKKPKGPPGFHIQCIHFKSKKCTFRVRFLQEKDEQSDKLIDSYIMQDYVLTHFNHKEYNKAEKELRNTKYKLMNHKELIKNVYDQIKEQKGNATPKYVERKLLEDYQIKIYSDIQDKSIRYKMKKKLANIIRDFRQEEKIGGTPNKKKQKLRDKETQSLEESKNSIGNLSEEIYIDSSEEESNNNKNNSKPPSSSQQQQQQQQQQEQQEKLQEPVAKEEWETFLCFDDDPSQNLCYYDTEFQYPLDF